MEVHPHGHVHSDKKWKEYLFQFVMLFLAITLSFFVENQREHYIEHQPHHGPVFIKPPTEETLDQLYTNALYETREFKRHIFIMKRHETAAIALIDALCKEFDLH